MAKPQGEQRRGRQYWGRALGVGFGLAVVAGLTVAIALAAISLGVARESLRRTLEEQATNALGAAVSIGEISGPLYPSATLRDVAISVDGETAIAVERARLQLDLWPALTGEAIVVREITVAGWRIVARRRSDGSWNLSAIGTAANETALPEAEGPAEASASRAVDIDRLVLADGVLVLHWSDDAPPLSLQANLEADSLRTPLDERAATRARIHALAVLDDANPDARGRVELRLEDGLLHVEGGELALPFGAARFTGEAEAASWLASGREATASLEASVRELDLAGLSGNTALASRLFADLAVGAHRAAGEGGARSVTLESTVAPSELAGAQIRSGSLRGRLHGDVWQLEGFELDSDLATLRASGRGRGEQLQALQADASVPELAALAPFLEEAPSLAGALEASASLRGRAAAPTGTLNITARGLRIADRELGALVLAAELRGDAAELRELSLTGGLLPLELDAPAIFRRVASAPSGVTLDGLALRSGSQRVELSGSFDATRLDGVELRLREIDLAELLRLAGSLDPATGAPLLSGLIDVDASLSGSPTHPLGEARVIVSQIRVPEPAAGSRAATGSRGLSGSGDLSGSESGSGAGSSQHGAPSAARMASLPNELRAQVLARNDRLSVEATLGRSGEDGSALQIDAQLPWSARDLDAPATLFDGPDARARIHADSLELALLGPWLPRAIRDPEGRAELDLDIAGAPEGPRISGRVGIRDGAFAVPVARQRYAPIDADLLIAGDRLTLERFDVGPAEARASLEGGIQLGGPGPASFALRADFRDFALSKSPLLRTAVRGKARVGGSLEALRIEGDLALTDARVLLPEAEDRELKEIRVFADDASGGSGLEIVERGRELGVWDAASMDLDLTVPPSWVRGRGAELELEGAVQLRKEPRDVLRAIGAAKTVRGGIRFQGSRFEIRRGTVTFDGGKDVADPLIDIVGVRHVRDVDIVVHLGGRASAPELVQLGGEPAMSEEEAFAYLVFGRPLEELASSERGALESAAVSLATRMALDEFSRLLGTARLVDSIDIEIDETGALESVRIGKYVGDRTFVRYGQGFGAEGEQDLEIEYRLTPHLSIESQMTTRGDAGLDLIWNAEY